MPKVSLIQTNFTAGEISPKCYGRVDVNRYQNGAASLENCIVDIQGAANRRPGTRYIAGTKIHTSKSILVPFVFSTTQAYVLEFGHLYMRVYQAGGNQILNGADPLEVPTPWTSAMLVDLDYTQGADTMFIFHPDTPIYTLKRLSVLNWQLQEAPWSVRPFGEVGDRFNASFSLGVNAVGAGIPAATSAPVFLIADVGRRITGPGGGVATITGFVSSTSVTVAVSEPFANATTAANQWVLEDSPQGSIKPSIAGPAGSEISLTFDNPSVLNGWRTQDVGKYVEVNGGLVFLTLYVDATQIKGVIRRELTSDVSSPANAWILEASVWSAFDGYPRTGAFYEQRLVTAGSKRFPQTVWGSRNGLYFDFTQGTDDDEGFSFDMPSTGQINPINRLVSSTVLLPLTFGGEFTMHGGVEKPLTPTNAQIKGRSVFGSAATVKPVRIGAEVLFVQRAGRKIRALSYDSDTYSYKAPDLTVLADHISESGITGMAYQQEPQSLLWCTREDGKMAVMTFDRDEGVIAWTPQATDGLYESSTSVPNPDGGDEVWVIVQRTVNGYTRRYVERFEDGYMSDCAIKGTHPTGTETWTGLDHLNGKQVWVKGDGVFMGTFTVTGNAVALPRAAKAVEIGLPYISEVELLRPEIGTGEGSAQLARMSTSRVALLVRDTTGCVVDTGNGFAEQVPFRHFDSGPVLDLPPEVTSGYVGVGTLGWFQSKAPLRVYQDKPYPFHLLAVVREITFNT